MPRKPANPLRVESLEDRWNLSALDPTGLGGQDVVSIDSRPAEPTAPASAGLVARYAGPGDASHPAGSDSADQLGTVDDQVEGFGNGTGARFPASFGQKGTTGAVVFSDVLATDSDPPPTVAPSDSFSVSAEGFTGGVYVGGGRFTNNADDQGIIVGTGTGGHVKVFDAGGDPSADGQTAGLSHANRLVYIASGDTATAEGQRGYIGWVPVSATG